MKRLVISCAALSLLFACHDFDADKATFCDGHKGVCGASAGGGGGTQDAGGGAGGGSGGGLGGGTGGGVGGGTGGGQGDAGGGGGESDAGDGGSLTDGGSSPTDTWAYEFGGYYCTYLNVWTLTTGSQGDVASAGRYGGNYCDVGTDGGEVTGAANMFITRFTPSGTPTQSIILPANSAGPTFVADDGALFQIFFAAGTYTYPNVGNVNCAFSSDPYWGTGNMCIVKFKPDGGFAQTWLSQSGCACTGNYESAVAALPTGGGNFVIAGSQSGNFTAPTGCTVANGGKSFLMNMGDAGCEISWDSCGLATSAAVDRLNGNQFIGVSGQATGPCALTGPANTSIQVNPGLANGDVQVARYDSTGVPKAQKTFYGWNAPNPLVAVGGGSTYVAARIVNTVMDAYLPDAGITNQFGGSDIAILKLFENNLQVTGYLVVGSDGDDDVTSLQYEADGGLWLTGVLYGNGMQFGDGGVLNAQDGGVFVAHLDAKTFDHKDSWIVPASGVPALVGMRLRDGYSPVAAFNFSGAVDLGPGPVSAPPPGKYGVVGTLTQP